MDDEIPNIERMFRLPRPRRQETVLAYARAYVADAAAYAAEFAEYDVPAAVFTEMTGLLDRFDRAENQADTDRERRGASTGGLRDAFQQGEKLQTKLSAIVKNKYHDNPQKLAAWTIASHLERPARTDK